jgi:hypothetical protein
MKRLLLGISLLGVAAVLGGCPIYPAQQEYQVCSANACYSCPDPSLSSACTPWPCQSDSDCSSGFSCDPVSSTCVAGSSGDGGYEGGSTTDCSVTGCPSGQVCKLSNGAAQCVTPGGSGDDASTGSDASTGNDGGTTADGPSGTDAAEAGIVTGPCNGDATCGGHGEKCIDGQCTPQGSLCSDGSQCVTSGSACVDGVCEARCSASSPCPTGYSCDLNRGVCNVNPGVCSGSGASSCQGGTTCVDGYCVPPCSTSDASSACPAGQACVNGGCIPDQKATFTCSNDGQSGQLATTCADGDICVHHDCYPACGADGGAACSGPAPNGTVCKNVTIETGTYSVCGTPTTLGSDCDPSQGSYCSGGKVCVDGYCQ